MFKQRIRLFPNNLFNLFVADQDGLSREATVGKYRVRAVDYWGRAGEYSKIISYS